VQYERVADELVGDEPVTADTALRLARYFGTTDRFWLDLKTRFDLEVEKDHLGDKVQASVHFNQPDGQRLDNTQLLSDGDARGFSRSPAATLERSE
jgi:plasmid maintenance system antidote protein VapI